MNDFTVSHHSVMRASLCSAALSVLLLAGCGDAPLLVSDMEQSIQAELAERGDDDAAVSAVAVQAGMRAAVAQAVQFNEAYRALGAIEAEAFSNIDVADSARGTQLSTNANIGGIRESGAAGGTTTGAAGGVNLSRLVFDGGESAATVNRATAQALVAQAERTARGNQLALDAARAWIDVWQFEERLRLLRSRTEEMDTLVAQVERMASNGMVDRAALEGVRRRIVDIALEEARLDASLQEARGRFARHFNTNVNAIAAPAEIITPDQARSYAQDWDDAPVLRKGAAELIMARNSLVIAEAAFQPRASISGGIRTPMERGASTDTTLGLSLTYTIGDGGRRDANLRAAQARLEAAQAQLADTRRGIETELSASIVRLNAIQRSMPLMQENIRLSAAEAEIARSQIVTGQSNLQRLIEAEIDNYRARDGQIAMQSEKITLQLTIAALTGALGRELGLDATPTE